jgi:hypothetical protein
MQIKFKENGMKRYFEALLIKLCADILLRRNVHRAMQVSRRDNNRMFEMAWELKAIAKRIETKYKDS